MRRPNSNRGNRPVQNSGPTVLKPSVPATQAEAAQAAREASEDYKTPPGQDNFNEFAREMAAQGIRESGIPEQIFMGEAVDTTKPMTRSGMRQLFNPGMGIGYVPDHVAKEYGLNREAEVERFVHMNDYGQMGNRDLDDWLGNNPGGRVCLNAEGKMYNMKGEILCAIPKVSQDSIDADFNEVAANIAGGRVGDPNDGPYERADLTPAEIERREGVAYQHLMDLLQGSPTDGMTWEQALERMSPEQTKAIQEEYRWRDRVRRDEGAVSGAARPGRELENQVDRSQESLKNAQRGRSTHAIGASFDASGKLVRA